MLLMLKILLKILVWLFLIPAILYVLFMSFITGGMIGLGVAMAVMVLIAVLYAYFDKQRSSNKLKPNYSTPSTGGRVFKSATLGAVLVVGAIPVLGIGGFAFNCQIIQRNKANKEFAPVLEQFDAVYFTDEATKPATVVSKGGDCVGSRPWVSVRKSQSINSSPAEALADIDSALEKQGYDLDRSSINYRYTSQYTAPSKCSLIVSTQIVAHDTTSPYKTFPLTLASDSKPCDSAIIASRNYETTKIKTVTLSAQRD